MALVHLQGGLCAKGKRPSDIIDLFTTLNVLSSIYGLFLQEKKREKDNYKNRPGRHFSREQPGKSDQQ